MFKFCLKLLYRVPVHLAKFALGWTMTLIGIPVLAVLLLFIPRNVEVLPRAFRWFDNHEAHLRDLTTTSSIDGLSGPHYYRANLKDPTGWWARFNWLALRNPTNYFNYKVLGFQVKDKLTVKFESGPRGIGENPPRPHGLHIVDVENGDGKRYWSIYWVRAWGFKKTRAIRFRMGYKIHNPDSKKDGHWIQFVFVPHPWKKVQER